MLHMLTGAMSMEEEDFIFDVNLAFKFSNPCVVIRSEEMNSVGISLTNVSWQSYSEDQAKQFALVLEEQILESGIDVVFLLSRGHKTLLDHLQARQLYYIIL